MTKLEAKQEFIELWGEQTIHNRRMHDKPALREAWNDFTDALCKGGRIAQKQYDEWLNPFLQPKAGRE